ncbi:MAG: hypothetical protein JW944_12310 [Deltaproteobacteria bacterium]|nr:hypothetical protein [Deltaproteobacteria bacterium]
MKNKKTFLRELIWFFCGVIAGLCVSLILYDIIDVDLDLGVMAAGVIATMLAIYVVRLTLWVFKKAM